MESPDLLNNLHDSLFSFSDLKIGDYQLGQISDQFTAFMGSGIVWDIKAVSLLISIILAIIIVLLNTKLGKFKALTTGVVTDIVKPLPKSDGGPTIARWAEIQRHVESTKEAEWKFAVIEADKLLDDILKKAGYVGDTMGDRLKNIQTGQVQSLNLIWEAHKIRNRLAHETNYFLRHAEAKKAVQFYGRALEEFGVL